MKKIRYIVSLLAAGSLFPASRPARTAEIVTVDDFVCAESDRTKKRGGRRQ